MSRPPVLLVFSLLLAFTTASADHQPSLCEREFCNCTPARHPNWMVVNCTVPNTQKLDIYEGDLPETTTDLIVTGAEAVMINANALSRLSDARLVHISDTKAVVLRKFSAMQMNIVNLYLDISKCNVLRIEERSFVNIKGPLSVTLKDCQHVSIESEAFSWLLSINIDNVGQLQLGSGSFMLDPTAANVGEHGPGMTIKMKDLVVPEFPGQTFGSSAALISMEGVQVRAIRPEAFSANTYNIVLAMNCSFHLIEGDSFTQKSLINNLHFHGCTIHQLASGALQSAVAKLNISHTKIDKVETGAINSTVVSVDISYCTFHTFKERGFELSSWNKLYMIGNSFDELAPNAIVGPSGSIHEVAFKDNEIEAMNPGSLDFLGKAFTKYGMYIDYKNNFYGQPCFCNMSSWFASGLGSESGEPFIDESYCTVDEFFARCFNVFDQNMPFSKFSRHVCNDKMSIKCESHNAHGEGAATEIKNPRFPHKKEEDDEDGISDRNKKVIGIVIVTTIGCILIALFISFIKWMRRRGHCLNLKDLFRNSHSSCGFCDRLCVCGNNGLDNAASISQLSVNEYSERHRLNEPRVQDMIQETTIPAAQNVDDIVPCEDKTTQTLPEELTKELLENLKEKLEDPENYVEAREMIEHLYELIKVEESCNTNSPTATKLEENIYELPFQNTSPRVGKNKKQMISVGTRAPSLDKLTPLSPYNRHPALSHEYFEPKDLAVHLYAEIVNNDKEKKSLLGSMPDVIAEQAIPRGPYLRAVREKMSSSVPTSPQKPFNTSFGSPQQTSTMKSNKSTNSNNSGKMINRPLPEKPATINDPGEGTSFRTG
ncbi:uncharacterized protein LOC123705555 [Colias croceus]|uniref:uncharacterized protein LOC123705555 n=1 Tax=Colias crocea TaxID=72248 RepID=UPI001E27C560|nr:uncharacterized protein LOC123705555 [Colias croceus]